MNAQISLSFRNVNFDITDIHGQPWLRGYQIGNALEYSDGAVAIAKLYDRNADEFTDSMTQVIELPTAGGKQQVRVFSLRGCHLLGMLARTKVAKEFRRWVLDVLEKEVSGSPNPKTTADDRTGLRQAVSALVGRCGIDYSSAYNMVHQRFGVAAIEDIPADKMNDAVQYVHTLTLHSGLNGEVLDRLPEKLQARKIAIDERTLISIGRLLLYAQEQRCFVSRYLPAFENLGIGGRGKLWSFVHDTDPVFEHIRRFFTSQCPALGHWAKDGDLDWLHRRILSTAEA